MENAKLLFRSGEVFVTIARFSAACCLLACLPALDTLAAGEPAAKKGKTQTAAVNGTIDSVDSDGIHVSARRGRKWLVRAQSGARLVIIGTATADYLKPGLVLQFKAELDDDGKTTDKISEVTIVTPNADNPLGCFGGKAGDGKRPANAGKATTRKADDDDLALLLESNGLKIVGKITSVDGKQVALRAGKRRVKMELADSAVIKVLVSDPGLLLPGSEIRASGTGTRGRVGRCQADNIEVTLAKPLTGKKKPSPAE
jgi:hypothetical protein